MLGTFPVAAWFFRVAIRVYRTTWRAVGTWLSSAVGDHAGRRSVPQAGVSFQETVVNFENSLHTIFKNRIGSNVLGSL